MKAIINRAEAIKRGLTSYYTGKSCRFGHVSERFTTDGSCSTCRNIKNSAKRQSIKRAYEEAHK